MRWFQRSATERDCADLRRQVEMLTSSLLEVEGLLSDTKDKLAMKSVESAQFQEQVDARDVEISILKLEVELLAAVHNRNFERVKAEIRAAGIEK